MIAVIGEWHEDIMMLVYTRVDVLFDQNNVIPEQVIRTVFN